MQQPISDIGFTEKYGLKYYSFLINIIIYSTVYQTTKSMEIFLFAIVFLPRIGSFLPKDDIYQQNYANQYNKHLYHMLAPIGCIIQLFIIMYYTWIHYHQFSYSYQSLISALIALPVATGLTINACHELIHRNQRILKIIGFIGLIPFQFTTYPIEHLYLHHKYVGTPQDDITPPKNMTVYNYYFKAIFSSYRQTFKYSKLFFAFCIILNISFLYTLYQFALNQFAGNEELALKKVGFFFLCTLTSLYIMQSGEYMQHYGLIYRNNNQQKPVEQVCSWNTVINPLYNWLGFRFQRHSDHHMNAYKIYSSLELNQKMPLYPFSFPQAIIATALPPLWYKIADHLVDRVIKQQKITEDDIKESNYWMRISNMITFVIMLVNIVIANNVND